MGFSMVLTSAQLSIYKDDKKIGSAEYKLHAGGLLNPTKYKSNESKIEPLVDQLVGGKVMSIELYLSKNRFKAP
jgi:hypothetical protein